jgi:hypothetical protein
MTNGMISISPSSTFLTYMYVAIFQLHMHMVYIYRSLFDMQELVWHTISFLVRDNLLTDKLMSQGFQLPRLQAAFCKCYGRYNNLIYPCKLSLGCMLSDIFHTNVLDTLILTTGRTVYRTVEIGLTAGVTGQQGMLTPPWHLIPPLICSEDLVRPFSGLYFL